jgi:predicted PurR-regulated permease PerM
MPPEAAPQRVVQFRVRTILSILALVIAVALLLEIVWIARQVITWILIALFLTLALNPAVEWFQRHRIRSRGLAVAVTYLLTLVAIVGVGALFVPTLVRQTNDFVQKLPDYIGDVTKGKGRFGFLETKYHIKEKVQKAVKEGGASKLFGLSGTALSLTKSVLTLVVAVLTIAFMTMFMLLEGPGWVDRFYALLPPESERRWRAVGRDIYRTVGGYVTGNLLISLVAGISSSIVLLIMGVPLALALGLVVAILDLIPLAGATFAAIIVATVAFLHSIPAGIVVIVFFVLYQQLENHVLQPIVYGRTVQVSPLVVLIAVLIGAELAGVLGALAAIPVAGSIQVVLVDFLRYRRDRIVTGPGPPEPAESPVRGTTI